MTNEELKDIFISKLEREQSALEMCKRKRKEAKDQKEYNKYNEWISDYRKTISDVICMMHSDFNIITLDESMILYNRYVFGAKV